MWINLFLHRTVVRLALLPFHTTPTHMQLTGSERETVDKQLKDAQSSAHMASAIMIQMGKELVDDVHGYVKESLKVIVSLIPEASDRIHRSYFWLMASTKLVMVTVR